MQEKLRVVSLCSGIGAQERGLKESGCFDIEVVGTSEIDINAIICYATIHCGLTQEMVENYPNYPSMAEMRHYLKDKNIGYSPEKEKEYNWFKSGKAFEKKVKTTWLACMLSKNLGDIQKIDKLPEADMLFWSTPCQSISLAGKLEGIAEDSGTRSSLIWQTIRLLRKAKETHTLPKYMMLENVKNLVGKTFIQDFNRLNEIIETEFGYNIQWKVINACNCGVPQNRERVFCIYIRKDVDKLRYEFPLPFDNGVILADVLEDDVDESYYVQTEKSEQLIAGLIDEGRIDLEKYINEMEHL